MNNQNLVKQIVQALGGERNIKSASNCMTRLRIDLKNESKVKMQKLKK